MRTTLTLFLALFAAATPAFGQRVNPDTDPVFLRAQQLVSGGQGVLGRAIVDSALAAAPSGSPEYAEALYWRAALAATAADAERDYRRLTIEYPISPRAEDALLTLAQLELTRRDYPQAVRHLERLVREYPSSTSAAKAHFWLARVHLELGDLPRGCVALARASAEAASSSVELHTQIDFHAQRCLGVDTSAVIAAGRPASGETRARPPQDPPAAAQPPARDAPPATPPPARQSAPPAQPPAREAPPPTQAAPGPPAGATQYTVQVAALNARAPAEELRDRLRARGFDARVVGAGQLYRVRIGFYPTREAAAVLANDLKQRGISRDAWVAEAEAR
ncbi:MAG TPA: SPOR domain-containing protein [Gemmatimonadaceae bacterium]|nr:SPOR domain-containing protein [Gemmatimonadaceae bacterium]